MDDQEQTGPTLHRLEAALQEQIDALQKVREGLQQPSLEQRVGNLERLVMKLKKELRDRSSIGPREIAMIVSVAVASWAVIKVASILVK